MIRKLAPDELVWFLSRALAFHGHSDPMGFAQRVHPRLSDPKRDADRTRVLIRDRRAPVAGAVVRSPGLPDDRSLYLDQLWFDDDDALRDFLAEVRREVEHEAIYVPLQGVVASVESRLRAALEPHGFEHRTFHHLRFELADTPPLGAPVTLEAWRLERDGDFRAVFERGEGEIVDATWAWLKRRRGPFLPDLWFLVRETPDRDPVGYAFAGTTEHGLDADYHLTAVGVVPEHRDSTRMLRRLLLSLLHDLAGRSPLGRIDTHLAATDPKLIEILRSLGFEPVERYATLLRTP